METAKLIIDGKEIEIQINEEQLKQLCQQKKKTGYERVESKKTYYAVFEDNSVESTTESCITFENSHYIAANYYSDKTVAENNARADKLMRQLRRFAVEYRETKLDWKNDMKPKFYIFYNNFNNNLNIECNTSFQSFGAIYFDTEKTAQLAIDAFKDELIWYFTEYKDSL